ncbi:hypothetical protein [Nonomuraea sp. NPDC049129]|uniref:hypothetical protein n=1 Tax=Nonomuraea sp. NPDC049129 TaxID=3155272 RepID=UPI0033F92BFE
MSALPMRVREEVIGALDLFREAPGDLHADTVALGHARDRNRRLAEVAREVVSYGGDLDDPSLGRR